jgi:hypothetical protein
MDNFIMQPSHLSGWNVMFVAGKAVVTLSQANFTHER